jgi:type VI secretion system protein ImpA
VSTIDLDRLLAEISLEAPSGKKDLEGDAKFVELQTKIEGTPARYDGKQELPAVGPNWREVRDDAFALLTCTHDLRVAMSFTRAMLHTDGLKGLSNGLELLCGLIDRYWDNLYPQLDPDDNNDPTIRINILVALSEGQDIIGPLMKTPLVAARGVGQFNLRDIHIASGKIEPPKSDESYVPTTELIEGAFKDCDLEELQTTGNVISAAIQHVNTLRNLLDEKINKPVKENGDDSLEDKKSQSYAVPDFDTLKKILKEMEGVVAKHLEARVPSDSSDTDETSPIEGSNHAKTGEGVSTQKGRPVVTINTRQDVIQALDRICTYYQNNEPGSPVPLLLKRARQLVEKNFVEIMQDLGLDSAAQIKTLFNGAADDTS